MNDFDAWNTIKSLSNEAFEEKMVPQKLPKDRQDLLYKFIQGKIEVNYTCKYDIEAYVLKCLTPEYYEKISHEGHPYSSSAFYEYDPPKNGQNIIKHGIGFGEVVSYSKKFGTLMVPIPNERDGERFAILSDLDLKRKSDKLAIPPLGIREMNCTISIANRREGKFRFISARLLSSKKKKYEETIAQVLEEIMLDEQARQGFIDQCVETLERHLIQQAPLNTSAPAAQRR